MIVKHAYSAACIAYLVMNYFTEVQSKAANIQTDRLPYSHTQPAQQKHAESLVYKLVSHNITTPESLTGYVVDEIQNFKILPINIFVSTLILTPFVKAVLWLRVETLHISSEVMGTLGYWSIYRLEI